MGELDGRTALVTGASRGIGLAIARRLAMAGATVAAVARTLEPDERGSGSLRETVALIERAGGSAVAVPGDISRAEDRERVVAESTAALGPIDILVNDAAVTFFARVEDIAEKRFRLMVEVQMWAPLHLTQLVLPTMYERGAGWVLNISSRASEHIPGPPFPAIWSKGGFAAYGMVKAGLERFTTALAAEGHERGVRANSLAPRDNVATPGAGAHDLVEGLVLEDASVMAEAALALVEGDLTGRVAVSQDLLAELDRRPVPLPG
ncbi:MAG TPA: SDR family NAD(P)-dependent oxidoreductase [Mycobacteriales bacterium]|nr:SDR family NAD(P)-dependent oxidoreductase [Mycobacteriales bacterium]